MEGDGYELIFTCVKGLSGVYENVYLPIDVEIGKTYTLSLKYVIQSAYIPWRTDRPFGVQVLRTPPGNGDYFGYSLADIQVVNEDYYKGEGSCTFTPNSSIVYLNIPGAYLADGRNNGWVLQLDLLKLEEGSEATEWTPSPDDETGGGETMSDFTRGRNLLRDTDWTSDIVSGFPTSNQVSYNAWRKEATARIEAEGDLWKIYSAASSTNTAKYGVYYDIELEPNTDYTLSADVGESFYIAVGNAGAWPVKNSGFVEDDGRASYTFNTGSVVNKRIYVYGISAGEQISYVNHLKLEYGTEATEWRPAPEDATYYSGGVEYMILARNTITVSIQRDTDSVYRFYKLQASTAAVPAKPTSIDTLPPSGWSATEPTYTEGSTNSLYFVDLTIFTDGTFTYTDVSLSSSYEAAKAAYTKAVAANNAATAANTTANSKNSVFYQTSAPSTSGRKTYDVWFDTDDGNKMYYWNGSAWTARQFNTSALANSCVTADLIASNAVTADKILAGAVVAGKLAADSVATNNIQAGAITAAKIEAGTITATQIASGTITGTQIAASTIKAANIDVTDLFAQTITATGSISGAEIHAATGSTIGDTSQTHVSMSANSMDIQYGNQSPFMHVGYSGSGDPSLPGSFPYYVLGTLSSPTTTVGFYSFGTGYKVAPVGNYSVAEGYGTKAFGVGAHAEGYQTIASAYTTFPQYEDNTGRYVTPGTSTTTGHTHAEGNATEALGNDSHSQNCQTHAYGDYSHAEGYGSYAYSVASHAEGQATRVYSDYSHAGGLGTIAASEAQTVIGKYNTYTEDSTSDPSVFDSGNYAFVIGNGSSDSARSNALTVDWSGNLIAAGDITATGIISTTGITSTGAITVNGSNVLKQSDIINNLTSTSTTAPLSAAQGKALNDKMINRAAKITLSGAQITNTSNTVWTTGTVTRDVVGGTNNLYLAAPTGTSNTSRYIQVKKSGYYLVSLICRFNAVTNAGNVKHFVLWDVTNNGTAGMGAIGRPTTWEDLSSTEVIYLTANNYYTFGGRSEDGNSTISSAAISFVALPS